MSGVTFHFFQGIRANIRVGNYPMQGIKSKSGAIKCCKEIKLLPFVMSGVTFHFFQGIRANIRVGNYPMLPMTFHEIDELDMVKDERRLAIDLVIFFLLNFYFSYFWGSPVLNFYCPGFPKVQLHTTCPFNRNAYASEPSSLTSVVYYRQGIRCAPRAP